MMIVNLAATVFVMMQLTLTGFSSFQDPQKSKKVIAQEALKETEEGCKEAKICVKGPCADLPCCKAFPIELPKVLDPKVFSPRVRLKISIQPDGSVKKVEVLKSTGIAELDQQFIDGVSKWCFEATEHGFEVDWGYALEVA